MPVPFPQRSPNAAADIAGPTTRSSNGDPAPAPKGERLVDRIAERWAVTGTTSGTCAWFGIGCAR